MPAVSKNDRGLLRLLNRFGLLRVSYPKILLFAEFSSFDGFATRNYEFFFAENTVLS